MALDIDKIKKLSPEKRIEELKKLKKEIESEAKKQEKEIAKLEKACKEEIQDKVEEEITKINEEEGLEKELKEVPKIKAPPQYGEKNQTVNDIQSELYTLSKTADWGENESQRLYNAEKQLEEVQQEQSSMSKYVADQVDTSRQVLKALKLYRGY